MKRLLLFLLALMFGGGAYAGPMVNVEYIHAAIKQQLGIEVPYNPVLENPKVAANMEYLLTAVDRANAILNHGVPITDYGNGEYATMFAADTIATDTVVSKLIKKKVNFAIVTTPDTSEFSIEIKGEGNFFVYWGDGTGEQLQRGGSVPIGSTYCANYVAKHLYNAPGVYTIGLGGRANHYCSFSTVGQENKYYTYVISFAPKENIAGISGSLGEVFPTFSDKEQPKFTEIFAGCTNLTGSIPEDLFKNISGSLKTGMFKNVFSGCSGLTGLSPKIKGVPLYEIWPDATSAQVGGCYNGATGLDDYADIPAVWGGGGE